METTYSVVTYTDQHKTVWDTFCKEAKNATFLFERDFMDYHQDRFEDHSLMIYKKNMLVAVMPANRVGTAIHTHQGLTYGGILLSAKVKLLDCIEIFKELLMFLNNDGFTTLYIKQIPRFYTRLPSEELEYLFFLLNAKCSRVDTASVIDYSNKLPIQSNRNEGVKKAQRHELSIKEDDNFKDFWDRILLPNLEKRHQATPTHTLEEIILLKKRFPEQIRQFNVYKEGNIVGGATLFETHTTAHVQYISADTNKQELGTLDFLFDYLITERFTDKKYFDFGISNEFDGTKLNKGLSYWKESFGARTFVHRFYEIPIENFTLLNDVVI